MLFRSLLGYDHYQDENPPHNNVYKDTNGYANTDVMTDGNFFVLSLQTIMETYTDVEFVRVMPESTYWVHDTIKPMLNFRQIDYREFVLEADIG